MPHRADGVGPALVDRHTRSRACRVTYPVVSRVRVSPKGATRRRVEAMNPLACVEFCGLPIHDIDTTIGYCRSRVSRADFDRPR